MSSQAVFEMNQRGPEEQSTEPRAEEKLPSRSRYNAVTHGLTAKTAVLPDEDPEAFLAKVEAYKQSLQTRTPLEDDLARRAAEACWRLERADRAEVARITRNRVIEQDAAAYRDELEAVKIGQRLFHSRQGPSQLYPFKDYPRDSMPRTSWAGEAADDPDDPALLVLHLENTLAGCRLLLKKWAELRRTLEMGIGFSSAEKFRAVRLMGKQPVSALSDLDITELFIACHVMAPQHKNAFQELRCEIDEEKFNRCKAEMNKRNLEAITPPDAAAARAVLLTLVDNAIDRLRTLEARRQQVASTLGGLQPDILTFDESREGGGLRRHQDICGRSMHRNLEAVNKLHRNQEAGWGKTREERERRSESRKKRQAGDRRLVVDEHGTVCYAVDYEGNVAEGMARFEAECGPQPPGMTSSPPGIDSNDIPRVQDFAHWIKEEKRNAQRGDAASMGLTAQRDRANNKNEILDLSWAYDSAAEPPSSRTDCDVEDPRQPESDAPNGAQAHSQGLRASGDQTNNQNGVSVVSGPFPVVTQRWSALADEAPVHDPVASMGLAAEEDRANNQNEIGPGSKTPVFG